MRLNNDINKHLATIILVGRPNVGKSTLFNRLLQQRLAIEHEQAHTTRDILVGLITFPNGAKLKILDSAGFDWKPQDELNRAAQQVKDEAMKKAAYILVLIDGQQGVTNEDEQLIKAIRKQNQPFSLVATKCDNSQTAQQIEKSLAQKSKSYFTVSAKHNLGITPLKDFLQQFASISKIGKTRPLKVAILGRPNSGKSALLNALSRQTLSIVSQEANTTRDPIEVELPLAKAKIKLKLTDTAGITRRSGRGGINKLALNRTLKQLDQADCVLLCLDWQEGVTTQDARIAALALKQHLSVIIVITKWDTNQAALTNPEEEQEKVLNNLRNRLRFLHSSPVIFTSATKRINLVAIKEQLIEVQRQRQQVVPDEELATLLEQLKQREPRFMGIKSIRQINTNPPRFAVDAKGLLNYSLRQRLISLLQENQTWSLTPLIILQKQDWDRAKRKKYR